MIWNESRILQTIQKLYHANAPLSYNALSRKNQALLSAAAYHFGSYRRAVEKAGIDYAAVLRRPRWSKAMIINEIKKARRSGYDLHWSAVTKRRDELGKAAFASLQPRLFGTWDRALHAAGLDADEINLYRKWNRNTIAFELKHMASEGEPLSSGAVQKEDPGLHAAALRYFGSYDAALRAAKINPASVRQRQTWTKQRVILELKKAGKGKKVLQDVAVRSKNPPLYGAAVRLFGSFAKARKSAGLKAK
jgi:hypothetical protein